MSDDGIKEVFLGEAQEILTNLESDIVQLEEQSGDQDIINRIFRYVHTLKGSSGIAGMNTIYDFTHVLENLLDSVRSGDLDVRHVLVDLILDSIDWIKDEIDRDGVPTEGSELIKEDLLVKMRSYKGEDLSAVEVGEAPAVESSHYDTLEKYYKISARFKESIFMNGIDPLMVMQDLLSMGELISRRVDRNKLPDLEKMDPEKCYLGWEVILKSTEPIDKIQDVFLFVNDDNDILIDDITTQFNSSMEASPMLEEKKIGEIMVDRGVITEDQLEEIVEMQQKDNEKLGDIVIKKGLASQQDVEEALKEQDKIKKRVEVSTIRVDTAKLDKLLNLLGEIVIGQSALSRISEEIEDEEAGFRLNNALYGLDRTTREFQEQIMSIRMVPVGPTFEQFRRFVRDTAHQLEKDITLNIEGGETELDKTVIEQIGDPLKHMIRNSIDHGVESSDERKKAGKSPQGTITLRAYHQEGNVYIEIGDDGKGIDLDKVKAKAIEQGYIKKDEDPSRDKILSFLFMPGLSTAERVGDLSGRGVGMDVVKTNIEKLRGTVEIRTEKGVGTTLRVKLPLTLAIIDGMLVNIGNHVYIIPLLSVVESIQPRREDIRTVEEKGEVILSRGEYVTLVRLYELFEIEAVHEDPWEGLVVMVESGSTQVGLLVDDLIGQQQIVIKSLDNFITRSRAVSGAAILGDGRVALIIDIHGLVEDLNVQL